MLLNLCLLFSWIVFLDGHRAKLCINCKHFVKESSLFSIDEYKYGKCKKYPIVESKTEKEIEYLVTGKREQKSELTELIHCSVVRKYEHMCGPEGKDYVYKRLLEKTIREHEE